MTTKVFRSTWCTSKNILNKNIFTTAKAPEGHLIMLSRSYTNKRNTQSTVDDAEIKLFSSMKDWWNPQGSMKPLHSMNTIRVPFIRDGLVELTDEGKTLKPLKNKTILDVGCGGGILAEGLARLGAKVTGIDASKELISMALEHRELDPKIAENKPEYHHITVEEHAMEHKDYYDGVVASEIIEHVNNKELFLKSCTETLRPGGRIFFTTPNRTRISQLASICVAENVLKILPQGTHQYEKFITPTELTFLLERNNCHVEITYGTFYHFLSNTWEFVKSQQLMFALQAVKLDTPTQL